MLLSFLVRPPPAFLRPLLRPLSTLQGEPPLPSPPSQLDLSRSNQTISAYHNSVMLSLKTKNRKNPNHPSKNPSYTHLLSYYSQHHTEFNNINYGTLLLLLANCPTSIHGRIKKNITFPILIQNLEKRMTSSDLAPEYSPVHVTHNNRSIATILHSLAKLHVHSLPILTEVISSAPAILANKNPNNSHAVSSICWALATLQHSPTPGPLDRRKAHPFFAAVNAHGMNLLPATNLSIANISWAAAKVDGPCGNVFRVADKQMTALLSDENPMIISNIVWAMATVGYKQPSVFERVEEEAGRIMGRARRAQHVSIVAWAFGTMQYHAPNLMREVDSKSALVMTGGPQEIANSAFAFAQVGYKPEIFFEELKGETERFVNAANSQEVCNLVWAIAVLGLSAEQESSMRTLWNRALAFKKGEISDAGLGQLYQTMLYAWADGVDIGGFGEEMGERVLLATKRSDSTRKGRKGISQTRYEKDFSRLLTRMGFEHETEVSPMDNENSGGFLAIDFANVERKIAVELDDEARHHLKGLSGNNSSAAARGEMQETGPTKAKRRLLVALGWRVVTVTGVRGIAEEHLSYAERERTNKSGGSDMRDLLMDEHDAVEHLKRAFRAQNIDLKAPKVKDK